MPIGQIRVARGLIKRGAESDKYIVNWQAKTRFSNQAKDSAYISILMYRHPETGQLTLELTRVDSVTI